MTIQSEVPEIPTPKTQNTTPYTDAAQTLVDQVRAMREQIPNFVVPATRGETQRMSAAASVPQAFVELTAVAVTNSSTLVRGGSADPARTRDRMSFARAYDPFADELETLAQFVRHSTTAARNGAGSDALTTYNLAKRLARRPENADLIPVVEDMRRALNHRGGRKSQRHSPATETTQEREPSLGSSSTEDSSDEK
jgi:hypothetical protein